MELELGLKIIKNLDDVCTDFRFAKDRGGTIFVSNETEVMFILTANLRGYRMENIKIDINDDATLITISGEKLVQEMVMEGLILHKKEIEMKRFTKVFQIPSGVILDQVNARFNEIDSTLTIYMPKLNKGIIGGGIQEVKDDKIKETQDRQKPNVVEKVDEVVEKAMPSSENWKKDEEEVSTRREKKEEKCKRVENEDKIEEIQEKGETSYGDRLEKEEEDCEGEEKGENNDGNRESDQNESERSDNKCSMLFSPCFFIGGAFIVSLVVSVCSFVRSKRK
ncbi:hypothetical protein RND81_03G063900 [Saponaria officinalis]|uniref:SHSP domain-containing protein n=1 Tax=Saponaria officinalis TaxID=3572 RepID=A0AAW1M577_SAPOF